MDTITGITHVLLQYQILFKIYHWQTHSYAKHIASDNLHENITKHIDLIVESIQGDHNKRIKFTPECSLKLSNMNDVNMRTLLGDFKLWLETDFTRAVSGSKYLLNIKDEMMADVNKTLYLFSLE